MTDLTLDTYSYTCEQCNTYVQNSLNEYKCKKCSIHLCESCYKQNRRFYCKNCNKNDPDPYMIKFIASLVLAIIAPLIILLIPAPIPAIFALLEPNSAVRGIYLIIISSSGVFVIFIIVAFQYYRKLNGSEIKNPTAEKIAGWTNNLTLTPEHGANLLNGMKKTPQNEQDAILD